MSKAPSTKATPARASKPQHVAPAPTKNVLRSGMLSNTRLNDKSGKVKGPVGRR